MGAEQPVEPTEHSLALQLLVAARDGEDTKKPIEGLTPVIRQIIKKIFASWKNSLTNLDAEDVEQEVLIRLMNSPPTKIKESELDDGRRAFVRVHSWIKITTNNYLKDQFRKRREVSSETEILELSSVKSDKAWNQLDVGHRSVEADATLEAAQRFLEEEYPLGARYVEVFRHNPTATTNELAEALETTAANIYQIRKRTRKALSDFDTLNRHEERR